MSSLKTSSEEFIEALDMKKLYRVAGVLLACAGLLAVALPVVAEAASPSRVQRKAYGILLNLSKGALAVSDKAVTANATTVGNELAPRVPALQVRSVPQAAKQLLAIEMDVQYAAAAERPLWRVLVTASEQTLKLPPVSRKVKSELRGFAALTVGGFALQTCSDLATWESSSFAASSEPFGTKLAAAWLNFPIPNLGDVLGFLLTARQRRDVGPVYARARTRVKHVEGLATRLLKASVAQNGL